MRKSKKNTTQTGGVLPTVVVVATTVFLQNIKPKMWCKKVPE